jgi:hypothetical protein
MAIKMNVGTQGGYHHFTVSFHTEDQALAFVGPRLSTHNFDQIDGHPIPEGWDRLNDLLYPVCHHGLSAQMCMDPVGDHHFGTAEWERQQYGDW